MAEAAVSLDLRAAAIRAVHDLSPHGYLGCHRYSASVADFAANAVLDRANRSGPSRGYGETPDLAALLEMSPRQVAAALSQLVPSVADGLADEHPEIIGSLDGAPPRLRYRANRILLQRRISELESELHRLGEDAPLSWVEWIHPRWLVHTLAERTEAEAVAELLRGQVAEYRQWLAEDRQILLFDAHGDGRVVEVFGDLDCADRIAVVVPGIANDKTNFSSSGDTGFRANAATLYRAAAAIDPDTATIAWLGYDTPDGIGGGLRRAARAGAPALQRFVAGIDPRSRAEVTVVAHSYGSLVAGLAAAEGLAVDDLVFVGSPGTGLAHSAEARLRPGGRVWVGLADGDPIAAALSPSELSRWWVPIPCMPSWLWHGANPAAASFGARRFATKGSTGHSAYFESGSLENLVRIMQGQYGTVDLID
jgi:hypothetical protein